MRTLRDLARRWLGPRADPFDPFSDRSWSAWRREYGVGPGVKSGYGPRQAYFARPDLRVAFHLGLTPKALRSYAIWLAVYGRPDLGLTDGEINGFIREVLDDPGRGLADIYLLTPDWQREQPDALSPGGWGQFLRWLDRECGPLGRWTRHARLPNVFRTPPRPGGINVLAQYRYACGLQEEGLQFVSAVRRLARPVSLRNLPSTAADGDDPAPYLDPESHDVSLIKIAAHSFLDEEYAKAGIHPRPGVYRVACLSWELEHFPVEPITHAGLADEFWAPSEFCAASIRTAVADRPVYAVQPSVRLDPAPPIARSAFGLPDDRFLYYFAFDAGSVLERKNPFGLIRAFRQAFRADDLAHLAIKVSRLESNPSARARLREEARQGGVTLIDSVLPRDVAFGLMGACDAYVSLHRAEGFGFTTAEAMGLGKPTIATAYSANLDYMTPGNSFLVNYRLVKIENPIRPYPAGAVWAEPDETHAAELMRRIYENRDAANRTALAGRAGVREFLSVDAFATRLGERLTAIESRRGKV